MENDILIQKKMLNFNYYNEKASISSECLLKLSRQNRIN